MHHAAGHLLDGLDREMIERIRTFNPYASSRKVSCPALKDLKPFCDDLIKEFFPQHNTLLDLATTLCREPTADSVSDDGIYGAAQMWFISPWPWSPSGSAGGLQRQAPDVAVESRAQLRRLPEAFGLLRSFYYCLPGKL